MARDILLSDDATTVVVNDATERSILTDTDTLKKAPSSTGKKNKEGLELFDNPLKFESCQVTVPTQTLVELVYQTLVSAEKETDPERYSPRYLIQSIELIVYNDQQLSGILLCCSGHD